VNEVSPFPSIFLTVAIRVIETRKFSHITAQGVPSLRHEAIVSFLDSVFLSAACLVERFLWMGVNPGV
jgi:hypothetical protein